MVQGDGHDEVLHNHRGAQQAQKGRSVMRKLHVLTAVSCGVFLVVGIASQSFVAAAGERRLAAEELTNTYGRECYDCNGLEDRTCEPTPGRLDACPGCSESARSTSLFCMDTDDWTGATYMVCTSGDDNYGQCWQYEKIVCAREHDCEPDGSVMPNMRCTSGNCHSGTNYCNECVDNGEIAGATPTEYWSYQCGD